LLSVVLDRIEDGHTAVLLREGRGSPILCPVDALPDGCEPGMWLLVELEGGEVVGTELDQEKTAAARDRVRAKLDLLRRRGRGGP
jgi:hypothetical protein